MVKRISKVLPEGHRERAVVAMMHLEKCALKVWDIAREFDCESVCAVMKNGVKLLICASDGPNVDKNVLKYDGTEKTDVPGGGG